MKDKAVGHASRPTDKKKRINKPKDTGIKLTGKQKQQVKPLEDEEMEDSWAGNQWDEGEDIELQNSHYDQNMSNQEVGDQIDDDEDAGVEGHDGQESQGQQGQQQEAGALGEAQQVEGDGENDVEEGVEEDGVEEDGVEEEDDAEYGDLLADNERNLEEYQKELGNKGVVYMSRIPPYMTPNQVRKLLQPYQVQRIYLLPESDWARSNRAKKGGSKRICFREGWIQFGDKRIAKVTALSLNGQKMVQKKGNFYSEDLWNLKYLPKFKWHNLTERLAHEQRMKKERLRLELDQERKVHEYYAGQVQKSKTIRGIIKRKEGKGQSEGESGQKPRKFGQTAALRETDDRE